MAQRPDLLKPAKPGVEPVLVRLRLRRIAHFAYFVAPTFVDEGPDKLWVSRREFEHSTAAHREAKDSGSSQLESLNDTYHVSDQQIRRVARRDAIRAAM